MRRRNRRQAELFASPGQPHAMTAERMRFYKRVLFLRAKGFTVFRCSSDHHMVDGKMFTTRQMLALVKRLSH